MGPAFPADCNLLRGRQLAEHVKVRSVDTVPDCETDPCVLVSDFVHIDSGAFMRTNIDIDDELMREAQNATGQTSKKATVEQALRLVIKLNRQRGTGAAFGKYPWRGRLQVSRRGRGIP